MKNTLNFTPVFLRITEGQIIRGKTGERRRGVKRTLEIRINRVSPGGYEPGRTAAGERMLRVKTGNPVELTLRVPKGSVDEVSICETRDRNFIR